LRQPHAPPLAPSRRVCLHQFFGAAGLLLLAAGPLAAGPRWRPAPPFGGQVTALAQAPSSPGVLFAGTMAAGIFRSTDGGESWAPSNHGLPALAIQELAVDPRDARTAFAATDWGTNAETLLRTRNGGASWIPIGRRGWGNPAALAFDPRRAGVLYVATAFARTDRGEVSGLFRSTDQGDTWVPVGFAGLNVLSVAIDPQRSRIVYATAPSDPQSSYADTVWKSDDRGQTWQPLALQTDHVELQGLTFDPARPGTLYVLGSRQVWSTADGGETWSTLAPLPVIDELFLQSLAASPAGALYLATTAGILRSPDGGATWLPAQVQNDSLAKAPPFDSVARVVVSPDAPDVVYAAGRQGVWKSASGGARWHLSSQGITAQTVRSLAVAADASVFAVLDSGVWRSLDRGRTWSRTHGIRAPLHPQSLLAVAPSDPSRLYGDAFRGQEVLRSDDGGAGWQYLGPGGGSLIFDVLALAIDPGDADTLFIGGDSYVGYGHQQQGFIYRSHDGGQTWDYVDAPFYAYPTALAIDPRQTSTLYELADYAGLFKSVDTGQTWKLVGLGLPEPNSASFITLPALAIDPAHTATLYAGTLGEGVFRSTNAGTTFRAMSCGLETATVTTLLVDPRDPARLYAAMPASFDKVGGIWSWDDAAQCWQPLADGLPVESLTGALALDPRPPAVLYAGTDGHGVYLLRLDTR
jgi:photosystem II stability/assembly factor-like uncharacterized protein